MNDNPQRVEEFKSAIGDLKLRDPSTKTERIWLNIGIALIVVALIIGVYVAFQSREESDPRAQTDLINLGLLGIMMTLTGVALFLRYSFGRLLRFWLVRIVYEMRSITDQAPSTNSSSAGVVGGQRDDQTTSVP